MQSDILGFDGNNDPFSVFWNLYPKKDAKKDALKAWRRLSFADQQAAISALPKHIQYWQLTGRERHSIPHPATWLNGERWHDELAIEPSSQRIDWRTSDQATLEKGASMNIHARPGEDMRAYRSRVEQAIRLMAH